MYRKLATTVFGPHITQVRLWWRWAPTLVVRRHRVLQPRMRFRLFLHIFSNAWSGCRLSVCLSVCLSVWLSVSLLQLCSMFKPFDGFRCHLAGTLAGTMTLCVEVPGPRMWPPRKEKVWLQPKHAIVKSKLPSWDKNKKRFRVLPDYFGVCCCCRRLCIK